MLEWELYDLKDRLQPVAGCGFSASGQAQAAQAAFPARGECQSALADRAFTCRTSRTRSQRWTQPVHLPRRNATHPGSIAPGRSQPIVLAGGRCTLPTGGGEGVLVTQGGRFGGYALYLKGGVPRSSTTSWGWSGPRWTRARRFPPDGIPCGWTSSMTAGGSARSAWPGCRSTVHHRARCARLRPSGCCFRCWKPSTWARILEPHGRGLPRPRPLYGSGPESDTHPEVTIIPSRLPLLRAPSWRRAASR